MNVTEFREKIKSGITLSVRGENFIVKEVVKFRLDDGSFYIKCFLNDGFVFADDLNENSFLLVKEIDTDFKEPFPDTLTFDNKEFGFLYTAHAIAEEISGEEIFKKNDSERFWDYKSKDDSYLSLGINDTTKEKMDFYGKIVENIDVKLSS